MPRHDSLRPFARAFAVAVAVLCTLAPSAVPAQAGAGEVTPPASAPAEAVADVTLGPERARELLDGARAGLEALAGEAQEGSPEAARRAALRRRVALMEEYLGLLEAERFRERTRAGLEERLTRARSELESLAARPESTPPEAVSQEEFEKLDETLAQQRERVNALREKLAQTRKRVDEELPRLIEETRERIEETDKRAGILEQQLAGAADEAERKALSLRVENARLEREVAEAALAAFESEAKLEQEEAPVLGAELDAAEKRLARLEQGYELYSQALERSLARDEQRAAAELARKERAADEAATPLAKFLAEQEARIARSERNRREAETALVGLKKDVAEQEKRLATERDEQEALRNLIRHSGTSGAAGDRIKITLRQLELRRQLIERSLRSGLSDRLEELRARRFEIDDTLFGLAESFAARRDDLLADLPLQEREAAAERAERLLGEYRSTLREEKALLTEAIALGQQLQTFLLQRLETANELERFIRARAFWLRDDRPLGLAALAPLGRELEGLAAWVADLASAPARARIAGEVSGSLAVVYALLLLVVVPAGLVYLRRRLQGVTQRVNDRVVAEGHSAGRLATTMVTGITSAALLPLYLLLAARLIATAGLPDELTTVAVRVLEHLAWFLFFYLLVRSYFRKDGIAVVQFDMPREAATAFYRAIRWILLAFGVWLLLWNVLDHPPFEHSALSRLAYTLFVVTAAVGAIRLVRPGSPFVRHRLSMLGDNVVTRNWQGIFRAFSVVVAAVIVLDVVGFRYAARSIGASLAWSLLLLGALPVLYALTRDVLDAVAARRRTTVVSEVTGEEEEAPREVARKVRGFVRAAFVVAGALLLASFWGLDQQALQALDDLHVYAVRVAGQEQEFVSAGDVLRAILFVVVTFWILRALPGIYEFALFPRLGFDEGVKYATMTISRYTVFVVGLFLALAEIHLDLGRLGWLMAAIGVGLGFGLQEIVSNFVSGIILLVERPVRPGDVVTVGGMSGTVQRINIRATTIMNFDRREVMLPNRNLITSEVTNWTRGDTVNRVVIPIGVAYGSDVDEVTSVLAEIAAEQPEVLEDPEPMVLFLAHGESSLDFELRVYVPSPSEILSVMDALNKRINKEFAARGIEIPFPQRDLHIRSSKVGLSEVELGSSRRAAS